MEIKFDYKCKAGVHQVKSLGRPGLESNETFTKIC